MLKLTVCLVLAVSVCYGVSVVDRDWEDWKVKYDKDYPSEEENNDRRRVWLENRDLVASHNARDDVTFKLEMNQFADELSEIVNGPVDTLPISDWDVEGVPNQFDWRDKGVVTEVKDQGQIGAVEAFAAAECVESFHAIHTGVLYDLSVAEVFGCCQANIQLPVVDDVFGCIHNIGGLCKNDTYKGIGRCGNSTCTAVAQTTGTKHVPAGDESALLKAVLEVPVFAVVSAGSPSFEMYSSGVYSDPGCTDRNLDHVMQVVGYGADDKGNPYWICRNSWGKNWGMNGYMLLQRGANRCGIASMAKYPY